MKKKVKKLTEMDKNKQKNFKKQSSKYIVSKTLNLGAHEAIPCAPEQGHIKGSNTNITND